VAPLKSTSAPLTLELASNVCVPAPKFSIAPAVTVKLPLLDPPPVKFTVPICTWVVAVLLKMIDTVVVPAPADFLNVPVLAKVDAAPPKSLAMASST
jgi:hypothetical protein